MATKMQHAIHIIAMLAVHATRLSAVQSSAAKVPGVFLRFRGRLRKSWYRSAYRICRVTCAALAQRASVRKTQGNSALRQVE